MPLWPLSPTFKTLVWVQAVLHKLEEQKLKALFTSGQKRNSVQKLLQAVMSTLQREKPKADMLMIMTVGDKACIIVCMAQVCSATTYDFKYISSYLCRWLSV